MTILGSDLVGISVLSQVSAPVQRFLFPLNGRKRGEGRKVLLKILTFHLLELAGSYLSEELVGITKKPKVEGVCVWIYQSYDLQVLKVTIFNYTSDIWTVFLQRKIG